MIETLDEEMGGTFSTALEASPCHPIFNDIVEANCYVVTSGEWILMSKYVAESINR